MKKFEFSKNQGVTLVALIVTVVVLMILSGIAINVLISNGDILKKETTEIIKNAQIDEQARNNRNNGKAK